MCGAASPSPSSSSSTSDSDSDSDAHFASAITPLLRLMGSNVFCVGGPGLGLAAKLCNNYLSGVIAIATSEAMNLGMRMGIEPGMLREVFGRSSAGNWVNGESAFAFAFVCAR